MYDERSAEKGGSSRNAKDSSKMVEFWHLRELF